MSRILIGMSDTVFAGRKKEATADVAARPVSTPQMISGPGQWSAVITASAAHRRDGTFPSTASDGQANAA